MMRTTSPRIIALTLLGIVLAALGGGLLATSVHRGGAPPGPARGLLAVASAEAAPLDSNSLRTTLRNMPASPGPCGPQITGPEMPGGAVDTTTMILAPQMPVEVMVLEAKVKWPRRYLYLQVPNGSCIGHISNHSQTLPPDPTLPAGVWFAVRHVSEDPAVGRPGGQIEMVRRFQNYPGQPWRSDSPMYRATTVEALRMLGDSSLPIYNLQSPVYERTGCGVTEDSVTRTPISTGFTLLRTPHVSNAWVETAASPPVCVGLIQTYGVFNGVEAWTPAVLRGELFVALREGDPQALGWKRIPAHDSIRIGDSTPPRVLILPLDSAARLLAGIAPGGGPPPPPPDTQPPPPPPATKITCDRAAGVTLYAVARITGQPTSLVQRRTNNSNAIYVDSTDARGCHGRATKVGSRWRAEVVTGQSAGALTWFWRKAANKDGLYAARADAVKRTWAVR